MKFYYVFFAFALVLTSALAQDLAPGDKVFVVLESPKGIPDSQISKIHSIAADGKIDLKQHGKFEVKTVEELKSVVQTIAKTSSAKHRFGWPDRFKVGLIDVAEGKINVNGAEVDFAKGMTCVDAIAMWKSRSGEQRFRNDSKFVYLISKGKMESLALSSKELSERKLPAGAIVIDRCDQVEPKAKKKVREEATDCD